MFEAGFAALQGAARDDYEQAARRLAPAIGALESVMMRYGRRVAGDLVTQLYDQVADIHEHLARYDASEVRRWLESMTTELEAYAARMSAMCEAAIEVTTFESICRRLESVGFVCSRAGSLDDPLGNQPLAWMLVADRTAPGA